ncbi:hypothetical protein [Actinoplanes derwentensis]|uniref:Uncharacterized protein n=1 Tax=Actinoplanes derwentensis TaxID=113562 RepID=A0A1H2D2P2_9ACTN|nr:hypothetical protein [Actinoplanes derwentensis]GID86861.1 hypothetical protein Ade03nite_57850 [Actinoplanes derwentensis]SDT76829.1 hypothetical protein SAMN04489716_7743 [Actinoplanes derwentensis]
MEINVMTTRPSMLLTSAWPLSASLPAAAAPVALLVAERAPVSQEHQVQAELGKAVLMAIDENKGTTGFKSNASIASKRYTDGGRGTPPRGRPV